MKTDTLVGVFNCSKSFIYTNKKLIKMSTIPNKIQVSINLDEVNMEHLYQGKKGRYLNLTLWNSPESPYGNDYRVDQDPGKDTREAMKAKGEKTRILGNGKAYQAAEGKLAKREDHHGGNQSAPSAPAPAPRNDMPF